MSTFQTRFETALQSHQQGNLQQAATLYNDLLNQEPDNSDVLHLLGILSQQSQQMDVSEAFIRRAIALHPNVAAYYNSLANNLLMQGKSDEAIEAYQLALRIQPDSEEYLLNLGDTYLQLGRSADTLALYEAHCQAFPNLVESRFQLAELYFQAGRPLDAIRTYETLLQLRPGNAAIHNNLAIVLQKTGQLQEALAHYNQASDLNPGFSDALYNRSALQLDLQQFEAAISGYEALLNTHPEFTPAHQGLGMSYYRLGDVASATRHFKTAASQTPQKILQWLSAETLCPILPASRQEIETYRHQTEQAIQTAMERLQENQAAEWEWADLLNTLCRPSFYLPYQGENDLTLRAQFGRFFQELFAQRHPEWMTPPPDAGRETPHIGILVTDFHEGVFCKYMGGLIQGLCQQGFPISFICSQNSAAIIERNLTQLEGISERSDFLIIPHSIPHAVSAIRERQLDVLFYFESGSDALNYFLPFFHLARMQCTSLGSPVTSGVPAMDYFLSTALIEPEDYPNHYSEQCVPFSNIPTSFITPRFAHSQTRAEGLATLGLSGNRHYYACPQSLFKIHPDMDSLLAGILANDPQGEILLVNSYYAPWQETLKRRFEKAFPTYHERVRWLPRLDYRQYLTLIQHADVLLDPLHFNGGVTSLEALAAGTPIITMPKTYARARMTSGFYQALGVSDYTVHSDESYIERAVEIASNREARQFLKEKILASKPQLFDHAQSVQEMSRFFREVHQKGRSGW